MVLHFAYAVLDWLSLWVYFVACLVAGLYLCMSANILTRVIPQTTHQVAFGNPLGLP